MQRDCKGRQIALYQLTYSYGYVIICDMKRRGTYLENQIRAAIKNSGLSINRLAKDSDVSQPVLCRFVNGQRGITLATASKLVEILGLELVHKKRKE